MTKLILTLVTGLVFSSNAFSADAGTSVIPEKRAVQNASEFRPHIGLLAGGAQPEGSGATASEVGFDIGYQPYIPYGAGLEYVHSRVDDGTDKRDRHTVLLKGTFNFGGTMTVIKDSYVGLGLGAAILPERTALVAAPLAGFDIPLQENRDQFVSLGASAKYSVVSDGEVDTFSLNGVVKYWF